ncbi:hypothetical protein BC827DRAFT_1265828 [Russula dissimulans]|nr:hypothetical protein BC827DRAFT_1265828 [Russula dissimulans]
MPSVRSHTKHIVPSPHFPRVPTAPSLSARRRPVIDVSPVALQGHYNAPYRADSVSSESSNCSTLVDNADVSIPVYLGDEHVMMQLDYILPTSEYTEYCVPPSPTSSLQPDEQLLATPYSSSLNLLSQSSPGSSKPRLWLHRHKRLPSPRKSPPSSPSDPRTQSFLASLLQARWPKSEPEEPIFGQTAPRAVSPFRGKQRPPSAASMPRSILRTDSHSSPRTIKSPRSLGCVKFVEQPGIWEYRCPEEEEADVEEAEVDEYGVNHPHVVWRTTPKDSDGDSATTLPPPGERTQDSFFKRFLGTSNNKSARPPVKERPVISGPMPLARAASLRQTREANRSHAELLKEISKGPPKKENKLRSLMGRYLKVS